MGSKRAFAREIAAAHLAAGDALGWFEELYRSSAGDHSLVPWADLKPNPNLTAWLDANPVAPGLSALKVGSGLGDDAEELAQRGLKVTAFDISATAVSWTRRRFPSSPVAYQVADLFAAPNGWRGAFDLVVESYTLQVLPAVLRADALARIAAFVAPGGLLLVIARGRGHSAPDGSMPWPLTKPELDRIPGLGFKQVSFEDYLDDEEPPVRRFRAAYRRTPHAPA